jgi:hypothetical protein
MFCLEMPVAEDGAALAAPEPGIQKMPLDTGAEVAYATDTAIPLPDVSIGCFNCDAQVTFPVSNHAGSAFTAVGRLAAARARAAIRTRH